ncbi:hypothetical protein A2U01_0051281, partial [Trifolium medium]|nr:hypothetical protein [Trifolium medium]
TFCNRCCGSGGGGVVVARSVFGRFSWLLVVRWMAAPLASLDGVVVVGGDVGVRCCGAVVVAFGFGAVGVWLILRVIGLL